jgi:hypothetical protein
MRSAVRMVIRRRWHSDRGRMPGVACMAGTLTPRTRPRFGRLVAARMSGWPGYEHRRCLSSLFDDLTTESTGTGTGEPVPAVAGQQMGPEGSACISPVPAVIPADGEAASVTGVRVGGCGLPPDRYRLLAWRGLGGCSPTRRRNGVGVRLWRLRCGRGRNGGGSLRCSGWSWPTIAVVRSLPARRGPTGPGRTCGPCLRGGRPRQSDAL